MPVKRFYLLIAAVFLIVVLLSYHKNNFTYSDNELEASPQVDTSKNYGGNTDTTQKYDDNDGDYDAPDKDSIYDDKVTNDEKVDTKPIVTKPETIKTTPDVATQTPNKSGKYDTLILIPSSWTQMQNRQWIRETIFGIKNNLEPCKKHDGNIIYKFYIHGHSTWLKTKFHSAEYNQGRVRELYGELMEYSDYHFTNVTYTDSHAIWGNALAWAVETFIPQTKIQVKNILIFDSTTLVSLPKIEESVKLLNAPNGFHYTWGESTSLAGMASYGVVEEIVKNRAAIIANHKLSDLFTASRFYFAAPTTPLKFQVKYGDAQLWASDIDQIDAATPVVGQVYQLEDWIPIAQKMAIQPTPACAVDTERKKNIALLTSSFIYVDMCMAEASLLSAENKRIYAAKHGYDFVARAAEFAQEEHRGRKPVWGKIGAIQKTLPHYEWLFWMDMDAVVVDLEKDLRDIINEADKLKTDKDQEISLIVARPVRDKMLNAGVMLIKNTDWSRRFFNEVQKKVDWYHKSSYEQAAIWELMTDPTWSSGVYLFDRDDHTMNTFPKQYQEGDFIVHFAPDGCPAVPVLEALKRIKAGESVLGVGAE
ncbi:hypothetical protein BGZ49_010135 [Haplosporangium sp. Z 27]|nr:hypothetical protein BGZ49_010135 [Haplosporangium sp. Z 27]